LGIERNNILPNNENKAHLQVKLTLSIIATAAIYALFAAVYSLNPTEWTKEAQILFVLSTVVVDFLIYNFKKK
jgi:hypothetical protein